MPSTDQPLPAATPRPRPRLLTTAEVAHQLRVDPSTVRRWIATGALPASRPGGHHRIHPDDLRALVGERRTSTPLTSSTPASDVVVAR